MAREDKTDGSIRDELRVQPGPVNLAGYDTLRKLDRPKGKKKDKGADVFGKYDKNANGNRDAGEIALGGQSVYVDANNSGTLDNG